MTVLVLVLAAAARPSGDEGRSLLRRELLHPEYHRDNLVVRLVAGSPVCSTAA